MAQIAAIRYISLSEIQKVKPEITEEYIDSHPTLFEQMLYQLGLDSKHLYEQQVAFHRNLFNEVVFGIRFVGLERVDDDWIYSGYASEEAKDKHRNNKLLNDLYRLRGMSE